LIIGVFTAAAAVSGPAFAEEAHEFVQGGQGVVTNLLKQPQSGARDAQIRNQLATMIDYDEMTKRSFRDHWTRDLSPDQQSEVAGLLRQLIERNYKCNLQKTLNYSISFKGQKDVNGEWRVRTDAQNTKNNREPPVRVEYQVREVNGKKMTVDIITENSSLVRNYGDQFDLMLSRPDQGWDYLVRKLQRKINTTSC
jgi:ABC-type transporter MlaC component